jgi:hypothetical protein
MRSPPVLPFAERAILSTPPPAPPPAGDTRNKRRGYRKATVCVGRDLSVTNFYIDKINVFLICYINQEASSQKPFDFAQGRERVERSESR